MQTKQKPKEDKIDPYIRVLRGHGLRQHGLKEDKIDPYTVAAGGAGIGLLLLTKSILIAIVGAVAALAAVHYYKKKVAKNAKM